MRTYNEKQDGSRPSATEVHEREILETLQVVQPKPRSETGMPAPDAGEAAASDGTTWIRVDRIRPMQGQPRKRIDPTEMAVFTSGIASEGQNDPVKVRRIQGDPDHDYELIGGERRWRAAIASGISHLKAIFREPKNFAEQFKLATIDNIGRSEMHHLDVAETIRTLQEQPEYSNLSTVAQVRAFSILWCKPLSWVANRLALNNLDPKVKAMLEPGLPASQTLSLAMGIFLADKARNDQILLATKVVMFGWSVKQAREYYAEITSERNEATSTTRKPKPKGKRPTWGGFHGHTTGHTVFRGCLSNFKYDLWKYKDNLSTLEQMFKALPRVKKDEILTLMQEDIALLGEMFEVLKKIV